jgi:hypothetical protein
VETPHAAEEAPSMTTAATDNPKDKDPQKHAITIYVNGREKTVTTKELSFDEIVALAFDNPPSGPNVYFTITYRRGHGDKPEGTLAEGETLKLKEGMIINVTPTDKS